MDTKKAIKALTHILLEIDNIDAKQHIHDAIKALDFATVDPVSRQDSPTSITSPRKPSRQHIAQMAIEDGAPPPQVVQPMAANSSMTEEQKSTILQMAQMTGKLREIQEWLRLPRSHGQAQNMIETLAPPDIRKVVG